MFESFLEMSPDYDLKNLREVDQLIDDMYDAGCRPILAIRASKAEHYLKKGYLAKKSWIKKAGNIIVGTFGRQPYDAGEERVFLRLNIPRHRIRARYTGPDNSFNGVVYITGDRLTQEELEVVEVGTAEEQVINHTRSKIREVSENRLN